MPVARSLEDHQANCLQVLRATLAKNISEHAAELSAALNIERRYLVEANFARLLGFVRNDSQLSRAMILLGRVSVSSYHQATFQLTESFQIELALLGQRDLFPHPWSGTKIIA